MSFSVLSFSTLLCVVATVVGLSCALPLKPNADVTLKLDSICNVTVVGDPCRVAVEVSSSLSPCKNVTVWPFVNSTQWGAQKTLLCPAATLNGPNTGTLVFYLPLAHEGNADISFIAAQQGDIDITTFPVGRPKDGFANVTLASLPDILVGALPLPFKAPSDSPLVGMEWEPWFTLHNDRWQLAEAVPSVGYYDSFNQDVIQLHAQWLTWSGVNFIAVDWTNNLWNIDHWSQRGIYAQELINATTATLEVYANMRKQGRPTPSFTLLLGLDNGPSEPVSCLQEEIDWVTANYLKQHPDLFVQLDGKPLLVVFDGGGMYNPSKNPLKAPQYTLRFMAAQMQNTGLEKRGYWSWMDGSLNPIPTPKPTGNGTECITTTCAFFADHGWLGPGAYGKQQGATLMRQMSFAAALSPQVLLLNQWNEYAGQPESASQQSYVDIYNSTLGNDMEPTDLEECAYNRPNNLRCGGWGFYYLNMIKATVAGIRGNPSTLLSVASPTNGTAVGATGLLNLEWYSFGPMPKQILVRLNDKVVVNTTQPVSPLSLDVSSVKPGARFTLVLEAPGSSSNFPLSRTSLDRNTASSIVPTVSLVLTRESDHQPNSSIPAVTSAQRGWMTLPSPEPYQYGASLKILPNGTVVAAFCSPGSSGAWDFIRMSSSRDTINWSDARVMLSPNPPLSKQSVCDPSLVQFHGVWYLYHTCINQDDVYANNRICVALSDSVDGPWSFYPQAVLQNPQCDPTGKQAYCVGQPSAVVHGDQLVVYFTQQTRQDQQGPNPGRVYYAISPDGVTFSPWEDNVIYSQRNVDVALSSNSGSFVFVQGDVGSTTLTWSGSADGFMWLSYANKTERTIEAPVPSFSGPSNNNPGLLTLPDGSFGSHTLVTYGSSYKSGWGDWHFAASWLHAFPNATQPTSAGAPSCTTCAPGGCDLWCTQQQGELSYGNCNSKDHDDGACCTCTKAPVQADCSQCAPNGCVQTCASDGHKGGYCAIPGSADPSHCCDCYD